MVIEKNEYIDSMFDGFEQIRLISDELNRIARAFSLTGNKVMATTLNEISIELYNRQDEMNKAVSLEINNRLSASKKGVADTLKLVFESCTKEG